MTRYIKWGIWAYLILLIFEGALRKWVMPGSADLLLVIRDPIVLGIYILALADGTMPRNGFIACVGALAIGSFVASFLAGQGNMLVTLFGIRTNYFHVPLIWVMATVLDRRDVERLGIAVLICTISMTILMVRQFQQPIDAWVNRGAGGGEGAQIYGAMGRIRPPGFFTFITGPMVFFPLATAFFLTSISNKKKAWVWWTTIAAGVCIVLALPVSISRGTAIISGCVAAVFVVCLIIKGAFNAAFLRTAISSIVVLFGLSLLPIFQEAQMVFMDRWDTAAAEVEGDAWGSLGARVTTGFTSPFTLMMDVPFFGHGIGVGSNVGAKLLSGGTGFLLSENEWERAMLELGPILGMGFIFMRVALFIMLGRVAWRALRERGDVLPMLIWAASVPPLLLQQWSQATQLGFAVFDAGLVLAAVNYPEEVDEDEETDEDEEESSNDDSDETSVDDEPQDLEQPESEVEKNRRRLRGLA